MLISNIVMSKVITKIIDDCQIDRRPKKIKRHEDKSVMKKVRKMLGEGACIYIYIPLTEHKCKIKFIEEA